jgi:hypothetical protein
LDLQRFEEEREKQVWPDRVMLCDRTSRRRVRSEQATGITSRQERSIFRANSLIEFRLFQVRIQCHKALLTDLKNSHSGAIFTFAWSVIRGGDKIPIDMKAGDGVFVGSLLKILRKLHRPYALQKLHVIHAALSMLTRIAPL